MPMKVPTTLRWKLASKREMPQATCSNMPSRPGKTILNTEKKFISSPANFAKKTTQLLRRVSGNPDAPLLARSSHPVEKFQGPALEEFLTEADPRFKPPAQWKKRSLALRDLSALTFPKLDKKLEETLRPYQKIGVAWLTHLFQNNLGGILADEMGLGKTLQALGFLSALRQKNGLLQTSLVVCPATLLENWKREAERFCPDFSTYIHHGSNRTEDKAALGKHDLVITSYGTLVRDIELLESMPLLCVIGDEAQHLKNRKTNNAKAMSSLNSEGRVLLTGTPIENSVSDLLSLLEFLLPGARPSLPTSSRGDERIWHEQRILKESAPYLLRRSKKEVAPELPDKIEQILYVDLTEEQQECYANVRQSAETELDKMAVSGATEGAMRMKTLTQLLRLRQTCCDPRLIDPEFPPDQSAKMNAFRELLYNCLEGGHRMLVFSQFVKVLQLLKAELEAAGLNFCYLDGSSKDRMAQVDRFQEDDTVSVPRPCPHFPLKDESSSRVLRLRTVYPTSCPSSNFSCLALAPISPLLPGETKGSGMNKEFSKKQLPIFSVEVKNKSLPNYPKKSNNSSLSK